MRTIKFRGKRVDTGEWVYGSLCQIALTGETSIVDWNDVSYSRREVDPETVGQFTGSYDKDNTEIYEDDILKTDDGLAVVEFEHTEFLAMDVSDSHTCNLLGWGDEKVIGNIHDNPELMGQN